VGIGKACIRALEGKANLGGAYEAKEVPLSVRSLKSWDIDVGTWMASATTRKMAKNLVDLILE
jgi:hypothetical protein